MTLEELIEFLRQDAQREKVYVLNPQRQREFADAYREIEILLDECIDAKMWCEMGELYNGYASIMIECESIIVREMQKFCTAIRKASNFEIYAIGEDRVRVNIMFHGIRTRV